MIMDVFIALLPTLISVVLTVVTRQVEVSLIAGITIGSIILHKEILLGIIGGTDAVVAVLSMPWLIKNIMSLKKN